MNKVSINDLAVERLSAEVNQGIDQLGGVLLNRFSIEATSKKVTLSLSIEMTPHRLVALLSVALIVIHQFMSGAVAH